MLLMSINSYSQGYTLNLHFGVFIHVYNPVYMYCINNNHLSDFDFNGGKQFQGRFSYCTSFVYGKNLHYTI